MWIFPAADIVHLIAPSPEDAEQLSMKQTSSIPRSIGSNVTVISLMQTALNTLDVNVAMFISNSTSDTTKLQIARYFYSEWRESTPGLEDSSDYDFLKFSGGSLINGTTRQYTWQFFSLPQSYNGLVLWTTAAHPLQYRDEKCVKLQVLPCKSHTTVDTAYQDSSFNISTRSNGYYGEKGDCYCLGMNETLFHINGTKSNAEATCGENAEWEDYGELQCWFGPQNITTEQTNYTAGEADAFNCSFLPGFPEHAELQLKIGDMNINSDYTLQSSDNGKNVSCQVTTNYTTAMGQIATSTNVEKIIVYYPPENSSVSDNDIVMLVNESKVVTFSFSANPVPDSGGISVDFSDEFGKTLSAYEWEKNSSDGTIYIYELIINWTPYDEYGTYYLCATTTSPEGSHCSSLTIRNEALATTSITDSSTTSPGRYDYSSLTLRNEALATTTITNSTIGTAVPIGAIVGAAIGASIFLVAAVVCFLRRNPASTKEECVNNIYELSPNEPEIQAVYAMVDRNRKRKTEKNSSEDQSTTPDEESISVVTDVYAVVNK